MVEAEAGISAEIRAELVAKGHSLRDAAKPHGGGQMIIIDEKSGFLIAGSDPRKDGLALGWQTSRPACLDLISRGLQQNGLL